MISKNAADKQREYALRLADENIALRRYNTVLKGILNSIAELHQEINGPYDNKVCGHCSIDENIYTEYPCPTILLVQKD